MISVIFPMLGLLGLKISGSIPCRHSAILLTGAFFRGRGTTLTQRPPSYSPAPLTLDIVLTFTFLFNFLEFLLYCVFVCFAIIFLLWHNFNPEAAILLTCPSHSHSDIFLKLSLRVFFNKFQFSNLQVYFYFSVWHNFNSEVTWRPLFLLFLSFWDFSFYLSLSDLTIDYSYPKLSFASDFPFFSF